MFSLARQQKYDFCPRAFYFRYKPLENAVPNGVIELVEDINLNESDKQSSNFVLHEMIKQVFYSEDIDLYHAKKLIYRNAKKHSLVKQKVDSLISQIESFFNSEFFIQTRPFLVSHIPIEEFPTINIGEVEVMGQVHLAWLEASGKMNVLRVSQDKEADTSFPTLYALKKYQVVPENLNIGVFNPKNWQVYWSPINWHSISKLQDKALNFIDSTEFYEHPPSKNLSHCELCEYGEVCYKYSSELDLV